MKIAITLPFYKIMETKAVESLLMMMSEIYNRGDHVDIYCTQSLSVAVARETLFRAILKKPKGNVDYILSLDTDHIYSASVLYSLIDKMEKNNLPMLSAAYKCRGRIDVYAHCSLDEQNRFYLTPYHDTDAGIKECEVVGFGFVVLKESFVRELGEKYNPLFKTEIRESGGVIVGDDVSFCRLVKQEGYPVCFDSDTRIGHLSTFVV